MSLNNANLAGKTDAAHPLLSPYMVQSIVLIFKLKGPSELTIAGGVLMNRDQEDPVSGDKLEGRYANYFKVGHNAFEFLLDFGQYYQGADRGHLHTRIITNPSYAKALLETLHEAISQYETTFGQIRKEMDE